MVFYPLIVYVKIRFAWEKWLLSQNQTYFAKRIRPTNLKLLALSLDQVKHRVATKHVSKDKNINKGPFKDPTSF